MNLRREYTFDDPRIGWAMRWVSQRRHNGQLASLAKFMTNPAGAAIVAAIGPLRKVVAVDAAAGAARRYLVVATDVDGKPGSVVQVQR